MSEDTITDLESEARTLTAEISIRRQRLQGLSRKHKGLRDSMELDSAQEKLAKAQYHELKEAPVVLMKEYDMVLFSIEKLRVRQDDARGELYLTEQQIKETEADLRLLEITLARNAQKIGAFGHLIPFRKP